MSNNTSDARDSDAAALLMLFQSQSQRIPPSEPAGAPAQPQPQQLQPKQQADPVEQPQPKEPAASGSALASTSTSSESVSASETPALLPPPAVEPAVARKSPPLQKQRKPLSSSSPGPAAAALATSNNSNIKAVVAAAALAAAAATPLPLLSHEDKPADKKVVFSTPEVPQNKDEPATPNDEPKKELEEEPKEESKEESARARPEIKDYRVDPDSGLIGCACGYDYDDGFTIQCDRCYRWQHAICMNINTEDEVPDDYLCYLCDKNKDIDPAEAKRKQNQFFQPKRRRSGSSNGAQEDTKRRQPSRGDQSPGANKERKPSGSKGSTKSNKNKKNEDDDLETEISGSGYQAFYYPIIANEYKNLNMKTFSERLPSLLANDESVRTLSKAQYKKLVSSPKFKLHVKAFTESSKQKFMGISRLGLYAGSAVDKGDILVELVGDLEFKQEYMDDTRNHYRVWGCPKPKVFFHPSLPISFDSRGLGNISRFIRKSCLPNCEIMTLNVGGAIKFAIVAKETLKAESELTLPWEWDVDHPIRLIATGKASFDALKPNDKQVLIDSVESILASCECGCASTGDCALYKVRKASSYLLRSTRKSAPEETERDSVTDSKYSPIYERLDHRDSQIVKKIENSRITETTPESEEKETDSDGLEFTIQKRRFARSLTGGIDVDMLPHKYRVIVKSLSATPRAVDAPHSSSESPEDLPTPIDIDPRAFQKIQRLPTDEFSKEAVKMEPVAVAAAIPLVTTAVPEVQPIQPKKKLSLADYKRTKKLQ